MNDLSKAPVTTGGQPAAASFEDRLDRLARLAVRVGLNLAAGQEVVMTAPVEALPLTRRITEHAYRAGASLVTTIFSDDRDVLARYAFAPDESFDRAPGWLYEGMAAAFRSGAARLAVVGEDPTLLSGQDPARVARANRARSQAYRPALELITASAINWSLVPYATAAWARAVFPGETEQGAAARLWDALFASTRADQPDPEGAWAAHNAVLMARRQRLTERRYHALHFRGPGTDLRVGLAEGHAWMGGISTAQNGITGNPNLPTEEVFTTPHRLRTEGYVTSTKPLSYQGTLIEGIRVRFQDGAITEANAAKGAEVLAQMISADEGARRLGEVALVPHSSPISRSGLLFFNTLFDENAASHIALGQAYKKCFVDAATLDDAGFDARGLNRSQIHVDWMIGSAEIDVDGVFADRRAEPVMRRGEWAA